MQLSNDKIVAISELGALCNALSLITEAVVDSVYNRNDVNSKFFYDMEDISKKITERLVIIYDEGENNEK